MNRQAMLRALTALATVLDADGVEAQIYVVGGAALALAFNNQRTTRDIDAVFEPKLKVYEAAQKVADQLDLPTDWLNDAVKGFVPQVDPSAIGVFEQPGLSVSAASARTLLGMKVFAARQENDADDIRFLAELLELSTAAEIFATVVELYPEDLIPARSSFLIEEMFPRSSVDPERIA